ncbi:hypothetical protein [Riemerella anatipestifer]|uniref:hypothetical protein n=1 Tax=Riemerella anatipestifer TaxID=34085 RepID=UPI000570371B|nr:hypothetical protein [Riemerella anatipestifer]
MESKVLLSRVIIIITNIWIKKQNNLNNDLLFVYCECVRAKGIVGAHHKKAEYIVLLAFCDSDCPKTDPWQMPWDWEGARPK